jgi:membrane protease subunit HflC
MNKLIGLLVILIIAIFILSGSMFTVNQSESAIVLNLGKIKTDDQGQEIVYGPGLHFKTPLADTSQKYDMRLRSLNIDSSRIVTKEQKDVRVDAYVEWRIDNISKFYRATSGNVSKADTLLSQVVAGTIRDEVGKRTIQELVNNHRDELISELMKVVRAQGKRLGIDIVDARVKSIDLPSTVTESVYQRMSSEREKDASRIRANGQQLAEEIKAQADAEVTVINETAMSTAKKIKAEGQMQAAKIYANAYDKNLSFYEFLRSMQAYDASLAQGNDVLILKPEGRFFQHFNPPAKNSK